MPLMAIPTRALIVIVIRVVIAIGGDEDKVCTITILGRDHRGIGTIQQNCRIRLAVTVGINSRAGYTIRARQGHVAFIDQGIGQRDDLSVLIIGDRVAIELGGGSGEGIVTRPTGKQIRAETADENVIAGSTNQRVIRHRRNNLSERHIVEQRAIGVRGTIGIRAREADRVITRIEGQGQRARGPLMRRVGDMQHFLAIDNDLELAGLRDLTAKLARRVIEGEAEFASVLDGDRLRLQDVGIATDTPVLAMGIQLDDMVVGVPTFREFRGTGNNAALNFDRRDARRARVKILGRPTRQILECPPVTVVETIDTILEIAIDDQLVTEPARRSGAIAAIQGVVTTTTGQQISAGLAEQGVLAASARQNVVTALAVNLVVAGAAGERVVTAIARRGRDHDAVDDVLTGIATAGRAAREVRRGEDQLVEHLFQIDLEHRLVRADRRDEVRLANDLAIAIRGPATLLAAITLGVEQPADPHRRHIDIVGEVEDHLLGQAGIDVMPELPGDRARRAVNADAAVLDNQIMGRGIAQDATFDPTPNHREAGIGLGEVIDIDGVGLGLAATNAPGSVGTKITPENIVAGVTADQIVAGTAAREIIIGAARQRIVASAAIQRVITSTADEAIVLAEAFETVIAIARVQRVVARITGQPVIADTAVQAIRAQVAPQHVIALAANQRGITIVIDMAGQIEHVIAEATIDHLDPVKAPTGEMQGDIVVLVGADQGIRGAVRPAIGISVETGMQRIARVVSLGVQDAAVGKRVVRIANLEVRDPAALIAMELIEIAASAAIQGVTAGATIQRVRSIAAEHAVIARAAIETVITGTARQGVGSGTAVDGIVTGARVNQIIAVTAFDLIVIG